VVVPQAEEPGPAERQKQAIDRACFVLMTDPEFEGLRLWWQVEAMQTALPPGAPVDPLRLAMAQGDRERLLAIQQRAEAHRRRIKEG
jgi:hypothetical protein